MNPKIYGYHLLDLYLQIRIRTQIWIYGLEGTFGRSWGKGEYNKNRVDKIFKREKKLCNSGHQFSYVSIK